MARAAVKSNRSKRRLPLTGIILGILAVAGLSLLVYAVWDSQRPVPSLGEAFPIASREHISTGQKATDFNSDPPTSGQHYDLPASPGYYDVAPLDEQLVHNLEHGYVIIYYDCEVRSDVNCDDLVAELQSEMRGEAISSFTRTPKLIVAPRPGMGNLITYTSWGHLHRADEFDPDTMREYIILYLDKAPEPNAQ
ncbi:MAG TPA: DUF3105 domain-containing protein [Anaerolineales bacterium]|nr:DUF3105 domain-containing protein [Anaerolineales bacterium]